MTTERSSKRMRIDRFMSLHLAINRRDVKLILAQKRITIDGVVAHDTQQIIDEFSHVMFDEQVLQANTPLYFMMNKPLGVVSATKDEQHQTVIDLLDHADRSSLHIVGRLDLNSSGLLLLTNDSRWSRKLMEPENKIAKVYRVRLENPLTESYISAFNDGMYFEYEDITTKPAKLTIISKTVAEVTLVEGRYHQIKRMFGRFRNPVLALHRVSIGGLLLDSKLIPGASRLLRDEEVSQVG